jgi:uncharacterized protein (TIGR03067 family)
MSLVRTIAFVAACALTAVAAEDKPAKFDPEKLLGKYVDIEGMKAGEKADPDRLKGQFVTVSKDVFKIEGDKPEQTFEFAYKLNTDKSPVEIDLEIQFPDDLKGNKARGIIALDGKTLKLCYHADNKDRPKKFESTPENGYFLWTMKRAE